MTALKETLIYCDGLASICPQEGAYGDGDTRTHTAASQRRTYVADGWHYWGGKDYCPHCWLIRNKTTPKHRKATP